MTYICDICGSCSKRPKYLESTAHINTLKHQTALAKNQSKVAPEVVPDNNNYLINSDENVQPNNIIETEMKVELYKIKKAITDRDEITISANDVREYVMNNETGFEVITGKVRGYFDFDLQYETKLDANNNELDDLTNAMNYAKTITGATDMVVLSSNGLKSNGRYTNSFHIITPTIYDSGKELLKQINNYEQSKSLIQPCGLDVVVYKGVGKKQLFRLPYTSKKGENRPLILTEIIDGKIIKHNDVPPADVFDRMLVSRGHCITPCEPTAPDIENQDVATVMDVFKNAMPEESNNWRFRNTKERKNGVVINLRRVAPSHCEFCDRIHDRDNTAYLFKFSDGNIAFGCIRGNKSKLIHKYEVKEIDPTELTSQFMNQFETAGFNVSVHNEQYCTDIKEFMTSKANLIGIRANMGTGKTFANSQVVANLLAENPNARVLVISMRISLAEKYSKDYPNFTCYLDDRKKPLNDNRLICQLDSLHRIRDKTSFDMVVIDEVDQSLRHIVSSTYMKNPNVRRNIKIFDSIIKHSNQVILMSANLTVQNMKYIRKLRSRSEDSNMVFYNEYVPNRYKILISEQTADVVAELMDDLKHGRKAYVAANYGIGKLEELKQQLIEFKPDVKILVICRTTLGKKNVKDALADPDTEWSKYDVIITSPSVQGGVSYDMKNKIDKVYGMFINTTNSSGDACQMLRRVRHPKNNKILVSYKKNNGFTPIYDRDEMVASIIKQRNEQFEAIEGVGDYYINSYGVEEFTNNDYFNLYIDTLIETNIDRRDWIQNFRNFQVMYGNMVSKYKSKLDKKEKQQIDSKGKEIKKKLTDEHNIELAEAVSIDKDQDDLLQKKMRYEPLSDAEQLKHQKFVITNAYNLNGIEDPKWFETYDDKKLMKVYKNLVVYYKEDRSLDDSLEELKRLEVEADVKRRTRLVDATDNTWEPRDTTEAIIKSLISDKHRYGKQKLLINMMKDMGFTSFDSKVVIDVAELKQRVNEFKKMDFEEMGSLLEKPKRKMVAIKNSNDKTYFKNMMKFINGSIESEFGIKIKPLKRNSSDYILYNKYMEEKLFVNPWKAVDGAFGKNTPILGRIEMPKEEVAEPKILRLYDDEGAESDYDDY